MTDDEADELEDSLISLEDFPNAGKDTEFRYWSLCVKHSFGLPTTGNHYFVPCIAYSWWAGLVH